MATPSTEDPSTKGVPRASAVTTSDTIVVRVGQQAKSYILHKRLLVYHSGFFRGALGGDFKESSEGIVNLKVTAIDTFDVFVDWMYEKRLPSCALLGCATPEGIRLLSNSYTMADMLMANGFKEAVFDELFLLFAKSTLRPSITVATRWCDRLPDHDPLHQLVVDSFCVNSEYARMSEECIELIPELPKTYLVRIVLKLGDLAKIRGSQWKLERKDYVFGNQVQTPLN